MAQDGPCTITVDHEANKFLTDRDGTATVSLLGPGKWTLRYYGDTPTDTTTTTQFIFISSSSEEGAPERVLALDSEPTDELYNISVTPLEDPPSANQLWTLEDAVAQESLPPIVHCRIQSVAQPCLSVAEAGSSALPRTDMNVAAVPNDLEGTKKKWKLDFVHV